LDEIQGALRATWQGPRGREWARRIAVRDLSYEDMLCVQAILGLYEGTRLGAFPDKLTAEQDAILWQLFNDIYRGQARGELTQEQMVNILAAWSGSTGAFGWGGLGKLPPRLRAPLAYVFAHRSLQKKQKVNAQMYYRSVKQEAPGGSVLARLADVERMKPEGQ